MKKHTILVVIHDVTYLRNYREVFRILLSRGHKMIFALPSKKEKNYKLPHPLKKQKNATIVQLPKFEKSSSTIFIKRLRSMHDTLHYYDESLSESYKIVERAHERTKSKIKDVIKEDLAKKKWRQYSKLLSLVDEAFETPQPIIQFVKGINPSAVLVIPILSQTARYQTDYLKAAHVLNIPVAVPVFSWDNLSNKGTFRVRPDMVYVWNEIQKDEAKKWHFIPDKSVVITGAPRFDNYFERKPSETSEETYRNFNLKPEKVLITYLCSSKFIAPDEIAFVKQWLRSLRNSDCDSLRSANVIIRPYPSRRDEWNEGEMLSEFKNIAFDNTDELISAVYNSDLVVGINSTAMLEAGAMNKAVFSIQDKLTEDGHKGSYHYQYLMTANGGLVHHSATIDEHIAQLTDAISNPEAYRIKSRKFSEFFLRPRGLNQEASPILADEIQKLCRKGKPLNVRRRLAVLLLRQFFKLKGWNHVLEMLGK